MSPPPSPSSISHRRRPPIRQPPPTPPPTCDNDKHHNHALSPGRYGVVFRARCKVSGDIVALKQVKLNAEVAGRVGFPTTALREINVLLMMQHPNIIQARVCVRYCDVKCVCMCARVCACVCTCVCV